MFRIGSCCACLLVLSACGESVGAEHSTGAAGASGSTSSAGTRGGSSGAPQIEGGMGGNTTGGPSGSAGVSGSAAGGGGRVNGEGGSVDHAGGSAGHAGAVSGASGSSGANGSAGSAGSPVTPSMKAFKGVANSPCAVRSALNVSWYYNWMQSEDDACKDGKGGEFVPMIWGHAGPEQSASGIKSALASMVSKGFRYVLGFNEPDNTGQANLTTATALSLLPAFDNTALEIGTPATQANTTGQAWFKDYMAKVAADTSLRDDFIAIHWYGWNAGSCDASASQLESYLKYAEGFPGNRPIWLTEWSCLNDSAPTPEGVLAFYKGALAMFAKHPRLQRYAWYPWTPNCELADKTSGALTPLGVAYAAAPAVK